MDSGGQRLKFRKVEKQDTDTGCQVRVTLAAQDKEYVGERSGLSTEDQTLAALATLDALSAALGDKVVFNLKGINANEIFPGLEEKLLVVVIEVQDGSSEMIMPGSCRSTNDPLESVIRATLDATNRIVETRL